MPLNPYIPPTATLADPEELDGNMLGVVAIRGYGRCCDSQTLSDYMFDSPSTSCNAASLAALCLPLHHFFRATYIPEKLIPTYSVHTAPKSDRDRSRINP